MIIWTDDLLPLYLIRHTPTKNIYLQESPDQIDPDIINNIPAEQFKDLSTNLLGKFRIEDVYINVISRDFLEAWEESCIVNTPVFNFDFCMDVTRGYFFLKIQDICSYAIETEMAQSGQKFSLSLKLRHTPLKCNFWHFSIVVFVNDTNVDSLKVSDNQKKKLWRTARVGLSNIVLATISEISTLHKTHYLKE
ncbi:hypothetical protein SAMD00024442_2_50 [Candidatus Symbiothrix dinenymphae]|nr:hypothetical protein SAMD00024442_2_50 [Candidatus Symbiothrix dinenymphae]